MSAIDSLRTSKLLIGGWAASAVVNIALMYALPGGETIPFHLVWIGLALIYGFTVWRAWSMIVTLVAVTVSTGYVFAHHAMLGETGWAETSEVPLMSALFGVMIWHVRRRQVALAEVARLAAAERRRAERQQLFVRLASHELRTPITVARGYVEMVRNVSDESATADLTIVLEELDKLTRISERLVKLMQADVAYRRHVRDVDAELVRILRRWEPSANRVWSVTSTVGLMPINEERLEAALDCLLENAIKFTRPGDHITVSGFTWPDSWVVEVTDTGIGMTDEQAAALTSATEPLRHTATGTGLGLAIARAVVEAWDGDLLVTSRIGVGTTVSLRIPITSRDQMGGRSISARSMTA
ncbi:sensor histidine kinase [Sphaerisporangium perillae]|uniref:sensor histidine kinase n=1 Tax=Sphaerisporangium perillae TaxID=2935860 RepID=UPI00200E1315|nr:HAMP domain-containing sensor histidine kinase [Sphaerisporangium perillae]